MMTALLPAAGSQVSVETDANHAKSCLAIMYLAQRMVAMYIMYQGMLGRAANMFLYVYTRQWYYNYINLVSVWI